MKYATHGRLTDHSDNNMYDNTIKYVFACLQLAA